MPVKQHSMVLLLQFCNRLATASCFYNYCYHWKSYSNERWSKQRNKNVYIWLSYTSFEPKLSACSCMSVPACVDSRLLKSMQKCRCNSSEPWKSTHTTKKNSHPHWRGNSGTYTFNQPSHFDLSPWQKKYGLPFSNTHCSTEACHIHTTEHKHKHSDSKKHPLTAIFLCEPGPCNPQWGWETLRIVEHSFTPLRWSHESKLPIKKQLQAAAGADSCSH